MMDLPRIIVAGTHSGAGKTSVTVALLSALANAGRRVQAFKVGPDYIDPGYHTAVTGRHSRNLDAWMLKQDAVRWVFSNAMREAEIGVIEGVMGLFDGLGSTSETASTAEMAKMLQAPVLLVLDGRGLSRSAAAMVTGYKHFDREVRIAGVILNKVASKKHAKLIGKAIETYTRVPVLGFLPLDADVQIPERHLGLVTAQEGSRLKELSEKLAHFASQNFKMEKIVRFAGGAPRFKPPEPVAAHNEASSPCRIGVARDAAFSFYYQDNLDLLERLGAEILPFSPLRDQRLPDVSGLYFGGGFPEIYAAELEANHAMRSILRERMAGGIPTYAECGGLMYLAESIMDGKGKERRMVGAIPGKVVMMDRLQNFGYTKATARQKTILAKPGDTIRGHEFHYSRWESELPEGRAAYELKKIRTGETRLEGFASDNILATYLHVHFLARPRWAQRFLEAAARFDQTKQTMEAV